MAAGSKSAYTDKQKRQAEHIEEGYEKRGVKPKVAEARAWATVNATSGGGKKSGSGRAKPAKRKPATKKTTTRKSPTKKKAASARKSTSRKAPTKRK